MRIKKTISVLFFVVIFLIACQNDSNGEKNKNEFGDSYWERIDALHSPTPRAHYSIAFDSLRTKTVLFGGGYWDNATTSLIRLDETWEFNGDKWELINTFTSPPAANGGSMAYDKLRNKIVLHGGTSYSVVFDDTWEYDGNDWTKVNNGTISKRRDFGFTFDEFLGKCILFGGSVWGEPRLNDT